MRSLLLGVSAAATALAGPLSAVASADCGGPGRPACTILRSPPALQSRPEPSALDPECVLLVGGLGSHVKDPKYLSFSPLVAGLLSSGTRIEDFEYDAYGPIALAGDQLRRRALELTAGCRAVHLVGHSMGGVVADRAFSHGLSGSDGDITYVALASPHNGATAARRLCGIGEIDENFAELLRMLSQLRPVPDVTAPAVCDLARVKPPRPPRLVPSVRLRLANDEVVVHSDFFDRRVDAREFLPDEPDQLIGHVGVLNNASVRAIVASSVTEGAITPDQRSGLYREVATEVSERLEPLLAAGYTEVSRHLFTAAIISRLASLTIEVLEEIRAWLAAFLVRFPPLLTHAPILYDAPIFAR